MTVGQSLWMISALGSLALAGCRVDTHKRAEGDNVKISTPFGGMQVKTNDAAPKGSLGLPEYPGAVLVTKDKDSGSADINMSFGRFQLRVKAMSYRTSDAPEKVKAFYKDALGRYGDVIQCSDNRAVGGPTRTAEGLTCDNDKENHITVDESVSSKFELKAGSKKHQHIVAVEPEGAGTKFGLVLLDLPGGFSGESNHESSQ